MKDEELEEAIRAMKDTFTILDFVKAFKRLFPETWNRLAELYGLYGSGTRYSASTYLSNRLSSYSRRTSPNLLVPTPTGWSPRESPSLRRTTPEERRQFGSQWIVIFHRTDR